MWEDEFVARVERVLSNRSPVGRGETPVDWGERAAAFEGALLRAAQIYRRYERWLALTVRVCFPRLGFAPILDGPAAEFEKLAAQDRFGVHQVTDDPEAADLLLFTQCHMLPKEWRLDEIRHHPLTEKYRAKAMVYDERDRPWCALPGVYVSMPATSFDCRYERAWGYYRHLDVVDSPVNPDLLFSFIGSPSDRCRQPLFGLYHPDAYVEEVRRFTFYDPRSPHFEERRARYREVLARTRFVLCPRGRGTSSLRLYETLAAGQVPVIISDQWVPPRGPDWERFSLDGPKVA